MIQYNGLQNNVENIFLEFFFVFKKNSTWATMTKYQFMNIFIFIWVNYFHFYDIYKPYLLIMYDFWQSIQLIKKPSILFLKTHKNNKNENFEILLMYKYFNI
jgi:hypothetical protein